MVINSLNINRNDGMLHESQTTLLQRPKVMDHKKLDDIYAEQVLEVAMQSREL